MAPARFRALALTRRVARAPLARRGLLPSLLVLFLSLALLHIARRRHAAPSMADAAALPGLTPHTEIADAADAAAADMQPAKGGEVVVLTAVNYAFREHLANLRCSLARIGLAHRLRVVPLDEPVARWARGAGFNVSATADGAANVADGHQGELRFDSAGFNLLSKFKIAAVRDALAQGADVLFTDADMFWCADALAEIVARAQNSGESLVMQSEWPRALLNSGFYFARAGKGTSALFEELLKYPGDAENDQVVFNRVLCNPRMGGKVVHGDEDFKIERRKDRRPKGCVRGNVTVGLLDRARYPTGGELFQGKKVFHFTRAALQGWCERKEVALLHNNCILGDKKTARFIVKGFWYVGDDGVSCMQEPAPITKDTLKRCGMPKCGREEFDNFFEALRKEQRNMSA